MRANGEEGLKQHDVGGGEGWCACTFTIRATLEGALTYVYQSLLNVSQAGYSRLSVMLVPEPRVHCL